LINIQIRFEYGRSISVVTNTQIKVFKYLPNIPITRPNGSSESAYDCHT
jgi:hypothetical protein